MVRPYAISGRYGEYLTLDEAERAYWVGRGAEEIGLIGYVKPIQFALLEQGRHPETEEKLRLRISQGQTHNGKQYSQGRTVYDFVVMAPKSASILGLFDERIIDAHKESVKQIQSQIEDHACVRIRKGELNETDAMRPTRNIVAGVWLHEKNRELEPLTHSHIAVLNMSFDHVEGRWKALQPVEMYRHRWDLSEAYRHELAERLQDYGYKLEPRELKDEIRYPKHAIPEREWGFEIAGVSQEIVRRFGTRTRQRDEAIARYKEGSPDAEITDILVTNLVRENRKPKQEYSSYERERLEIREQQREKLTQAERISLRQTVEKAYERSHKLRLRMDVAEGEEHTPSHRLTYGPRISM